MREWFQYPEWTGDMHRGPWRSPPGAPRARRAIYAAHEVVGIYANQLDFHNPEGLTCEQRSTLARHVADGERLRTDSDDIDTVGRMLTKRLYRNPDKTNTKAFQKKSNSGKGLTRRQELAARNYKGEDDGVPIGESFDTLNARYDLF